MRRNPQKWVADQLATARLRNAMTNQYLSRHRQAACLKLSNGGEKTAEGTAA